jgi:hypothetical protein
MARFFGSSICARWNPAACANSIVTMQLRSRPKLRLVPTPAPTPAAPALPLLALEPAERLAA